ncbi:LuxR C-terminal-related transcriptional regulator [soil metagenome]
MVSVEDFSRLVAGIYAAAVAPDKWEATLRDIHRILEGSGGGLCTPNGAVWSIETADLPAEAKESYGVYYCQLDHVLDAVRQGTVGVVRTGTELIAPYRKTEFYAGWMHPYHLEDGLFVRIGSDARPLCFVVASPRRTESFDSLDRLKVVRALVPHLQQATAIQDRLGVLTNHVAGLTGALDAIRHGVLIVAADRLVVTSNSAGEHVLRAQDGLSVRSGRVGALHTDDDVELRSAIADAVVGDGSGVRRARSITCTRPSHKHPYILHVLPSHRYALIVVIDPEAEPEPPVALLRRLYHLTQTEAEVALHVMHGVDLKQISEQLSVSLTTVRTHLQHVFDKTDTHRQAELVRLLHLIDP